jgi:endonuclease III
MLYAMGRAVFPADAHCLRVLKRIGLISLTLSNKSDRERAQKELNDILSGDYQLCYDLHTLLIEHGKRVCGRNPCCDECCLRSICTFHSAAASSS